MKTEIIYISSAMLIPHPKNPRVDLGDLSELQESIKENGILQNLTVVPLDTAGAYQVVIGHRRLQAAINAGLDTLPCIVVEMSHEEQLSTMLLENMQRSDLTPYEQGLGFQQCLDFGMDEATISKRTGFKRKTVKSRLKLLELDQTKVKAATNATIDDFLKLEAIENVEQKNRLVGLIGTNNFNLEIEKAKAAESLSIDTNDTISALVKEKQVEDAIPEDDISKLSANLRRTFIKELFKEKITGPQIQSAIEYLLESYVEKSVSTDLIEFHEVTLGAGKDIGQIIETAKKHKSNYLIAMVYSILEQRASKNKVYEYLCELGYVMSDEESEMVRSDKTAN